MVVDGRREKGTNAGWQMAMNSSAYYGVDYGGYCKGGGWKERRIE